MFNLTATETNQFELPPFFLKVSVNFAIISCPSSVNHVESTNILLFSGCCRNIAGENLAKLGRLRFFATRHFLCHMKSVASVMPGRSWLGVGWCSFVLLLVFCS